MIKVIIYILKLTFNFMIIGGSIYSFYLAISATNDNYIGRIKSEIKSKYRIFNSLIKDNEINHGFRKHINKMNYIVSDNNFFEKSYFRFIFASFSCFIITFLSLILSVKDMPMNFVVDDPFIETVTKGAAGTAETSVSIFYILLASVLASLIPYLRLRYKYSLARIKVSYELLDVVRLTIGETHLSVGPALVKVSYQLPKGSAIKIPLKNLGELLVNYKDEKELEDACRDFSLAIDTAFAVSFVSMVIHTQREGRAGWEDSLFSLSDDMEKQKMSIIEAKDSSRDAINLSSYGNILVYLIVAISMAAFLKPNVFLNLQFRTNSGLAGFTLSFSLILISYISTKFLTRIKLDY